MKINLRYWARRALPYALGAGFVGSLALGAVGSASALPFHLMVPADYSGTAASGTGGSDDSLYAAAAVGVIAVGAVGAVALLIHRRNKAEDEAMNNQADQSGYYQAPPDQGGYAQGYPEYPPDAGAPADGMVPPPPPPPPA